MMNIKRNVLINSNIETIETFKQVKEFVCIYFPLVITASQDGVVRSAATCIMLMGAQHREVGPTYTIK